VLARETSLVRSHVLQREIRAGGLDSEQELARRHGLRDGRAAIESYEQRQSSHTSKRRE